jgi:hypothetical protein
VRDIGRQGKGKGKGMRRKEGRKGKGKKRSIVSKRSSLNENISDQGSRLHLFLTVIQTFLHV